MISFSFLILLISFSSLAFDTGTIKALQNAMDKQVKQKRTVGLVVGLYDKGKRVVLTSGSSDYDKKASLTGDEYFSIGSVSKTFTSLLLSHAVVTKGISIDTKVKEIIGEFSGDEVGEVSLRQLSSHSSGIQRDPNQLSRAGVYLPLENYSYELLVKELKNAKFSKDLKSMKYSNLGVALLGVCLEKIYKQDFEAALRENILKPLGLSEVKVSVDKSFEAMMSKKYDESFEQLPIWRDLGVFNSVGSFKADIRTMLDYVSYQLNPAKTLLKKAILNSHSMLHDFNEGDDLAYGWIMKQVGNDIVYWHNGYTYGFKTDVHFMPSKSKAMVVFNNTGTTIDCLGRIFFTDDLDCDIKDVLSEDQISLNEFSGLYDAESFVFKVYQTHRDFLKLQVVGQEHGVRLFRVSQNRYEYLDGEGEVVFNDDKTMTLKQSGETITAQKL